jgi:hypothetical protein
LRVTANHAIPDSPDLEHVKSAVLDLPEVDMANSLRWGPEGKPKADEEGARLEAAENSLCYLSCLLLKFLLPVLRYRSRFSLAR